MVQLLRSKSLIDKQITRLKTECQSLIEAGVTPHLNVFLVGSNPSSVIYTNHKKTFCEKIGARCQILRLPENISVKDFMREVQEIVTRDDVHGALIQLPVPKQLEHLDLANMIPPEKDVDGFHKDNIMGLFQGDKGKKFLIPCTPKGVITLLQHYQIDLEGKNVCVVGRSEIVGKPLALLLTNHNATVTLCHSKTKNLEHHTTQAEIVISAVGKKDFITSKHIGKNKPVVIDVGTNVDAHGKLTGDVNFDQVAPHCSSITPVPGGVGPMTVFSVAENLLLAAKHASTKL